MSDVSSTRAPKSAVRPSRYLVALAGLALLVLLSLPFAVNDYLLYVVNLTLVYALAAVGFNIVLGYLGQLAFANAAFFGIGAYAFAVSTSAWNLPFLAALAFAAAVGGATGFVVGLLAPRLRRYYLAIVTLVFGELLRWLYSTPCAALSSRAPPHRIFRKGVVQVSQGRDLFPEMSVLENLELGATLRNADLAANLARVLGYFPRLAERRQQVVGTLSGGEQQMVDIGRALMGSPRILLLDEPSGGLAPRFVQEIGRIMQTLKAAGTTMLLVEQNISLAMSVADRFYILRDRRIVHAGLSNELSTDHAALAHEYYL